LPLVALVELLKVLILMNILFMEPSESITNPQELDGTVCKFTEPCNTAFKVACPTGKPRGRKKLPWWTQQLSILRTNCRCMFNRAKAGNEDTNCLNYKYELASYLHIDTKYHNSTHLF